MTVVGIFARKAFLFVLDAETLGLSGLFSSVITMLSLAELGIGPAMIFSLYKPLAENDETLCRSLMQLYRKAYRIIGLVVFGAGLALSPFITLLLKNIPEQIEHIHLIFLLFVADTAVSYFNAYKRSLIIASQSHYKIDSVHTIVYIARNIVQAILLFCFGSYYLFLAVQILATVCENIWLSQWANQHFPWLCKGKVEAPLPSDVRTSITRNVKAMIFHRVGGVVFDSIDNLLISRFFGVLFLGLYSNYLLVLNAVKSLISAMFSAISASIGDFAATQTKEESYHLYRRVHFVNFWLAVFTSTGIYILLPPFISLFFGENYRIDNAVFAVIATNFYIECMRRDILTFKESFGLPWHDRYKPLISALVNAVASVLLALRLGVIGVFIGTTITQLCVNVWVEAKVVFNHAFGKSVATFLKQHFVNALLWLMIVALTRSICSALPRLSDLSSFFVKGGLCLVVPNIVLILCYCRREEFQYILATMKGFLPRCRK